MASVFPGLCAIAAHSDRGIFIKLQVSHEFSRGVVFKLIAGWGRDILTVSVAALQSDEQEYPDTFLHLSFGKAGTS
jgi:hypothetical protein